jgi:hypothetical protein
MMQKTKFIGTEPISVNPRAEISSYKNGFGLTNAGLVNTEITMM